MSEEVKYCNDNSKAVEAEPRIISIVDAPIEEVIEIMKNPEKKKGLDMEEIKRQDKEARKAKIKAKKEVRAIRKEAKKEAEKDKPKPPKKSKPSKYGGNNPKNPLKYSKEGREKIKEYREKAIEEYNRLKAKKPLESIRGDVGNMGQMPPARRNNATGNRTQEIKQQRAFHTVPDDFTIERRGSIKKNIRKDEGPPRLSRGNLMKFM